MTLVVRWTGRESRLLREALRMSVRGFATYLGMPVRTISKWEQHGTARTPRPELQAMLDTALARASAEQQARFDRTIHAIEVLEGGENATDRRQFLITTTLASAAYSSGVAPGWAAPVRAAVLDTASVMRAAKNGGHGVPPAIVARRVIAASLASDHAVLTQELPFAIGQVEWAALAGDDDRRACLQAVSDVLATAAWTLIKADDSRAASVAAGRAITAAEDVGDPLRLAAATRCLSEVHMRAGAFGDATRVAFLAAVQLDDAHTGDPVGGQAVWCLRGAAFLSAAAAAARRHDRREADAALVAAARCADALGADRADIGTVFGPTNVAIHRVAVAVELGDAKAAIDHARGVDVSRLPIALKERRARFTIDVARAYAGLGEDSAAVAALLDAETQSPDETRTHRHTHALVRALLQNHVTPETRRLAERCGVAA